MGVADLGSSPLTRGKHSDSTRLKAPLGLIPAHAGKTVIEAMSCSMVGAHPRSRGENNATQAQVDITAGSSPLTRGKPGRRRVSR